MGAMSNKLRNTPLVKPLISTQITKINVKVILTHSESSVFYISTVYISACLECRISSLRDKEITSYLSMVSRFLQLGKEIGLQLPLYTGNHEEKNFLYKCLGVLLRKIGTTDFIAEYLNVIFEDVDHSDQTEREGCAMGLGNNKS